MNPPPLSSPDKRKDRLKWLLPLIGVVAVLLLFCVILTGLGVAVFAGYAYWANKEIAMEPEVVSPQKLQADYLLWQQSRQKLADWSVAPPAGEPEVIRKAGFWEKWFRLPPDSLIQTALKKKLPAGYRIKELQLTNYEKNGEDYSLNYSATVIAGEDQLLVPVQRYNPTAKSKTFLKYSTYLIYAPDLPSGWTYSPQNARRIFAAGQPFVFDWQLHSVAKSEGAWKVLDADPLPFERNPDFESRTLAESGAKGVLLLRSAGELGRAEQQTLMAVSELDARIASIESESAAYRQQLMANLPARGVDRGGAGGTGTPTKAGVGTVAGAGTGALIGGLAGGGDGAAIGAGAGAVAGLLGGFMVGRSDEKRAAERQNSYRNSAVRQAESQAANHKASLYRQLEEELREKSEQHNAQIKSSPGERTPAPYRPAD